MLWGGLGTTKKVNGGRKNGIRGGGYFAGINGCVRKQQL
jgi:hypothetical protein